MEKQNEVKLSDNVSTFISHRLDGWQAGFTIQQQTFVLQPVGQGIDGLSCATWYQKQLETALTKIVNNKYEILLP